jgi:hypothetical protein
MKGGGQYENADEIMCRFVRQRGFIFAPDLARLVLFRRIYAASDFDRGRLFHTQSHTSKGEMRIEQTQ